MPRGSVWLFCDMIALIKYPNPSNAMCLPFADPFLVCFRIVSTKSGPFLVERWCSDTDDALKINLV